MQPLARWMVGLLLLSQLAVAAQACVLARVDPAYAFSEEMAPEGCEGMQGTQGEQNLCLAHCLQADQASQPTDFHFLAAALQLFATEPFPALLKPNLPSRQMLVRAPSSGPPLQIIFCTYQV